jgi:hypothetical protein
MTGTVEPLILDLIEWVANRDRSYEEVMEAWRTSCPVCRSGKMRTTAA